jgi:hypothetical protein
LNLGDDDELAVGGEVPAKVLQKYREGRAETQRYMSAVALTTATGTEEGGRLPGRVSRATIKMGGGAGTVPESGTVRRSGEGEGNRKYAFDGSDALRTDAKEASLWGRLGMAEEWRTFMEAAGASMSNCTTSTCTSLQKI